MFQFMVHDKWSNALFLHWRIPSHLGTLLAEHTSPFQLDRTTSKDGDDDKKENAWVGLILLTEQNVGPSILRSKWNTVTHHGVNVRTYVKGPDYENNKEDKGIHFASLECDDAITSFGANLFGMPYKRARVERNFTITSNDVISPQSGGKNGKNNETILLKKGVLSTSEIDDILCADGDINQRVQSLSLKSVRIQRSCLSFYCSVWSLLEMLWSILRTILPIVLKKGIPEKDKAMHSTTLNITQKIPTNDSSSNNKNNKNTAYTVEAQWERDPSSSLPDPALANFFFKRYHVYTRKYGLHWKGTVHHEPWIIERAVLKKLVIENIDAYEPREVRPIIRYMAENEPESVLFSRGVGPIQFEMLRPV